MTLFVHASEEKSYPPSSEPETSESEFTDRGWEQMTTNDEHPPTFHTSMHIYLISVSLFQSLAVIVVNGHPQCITRTRIYGESGVDCRLWMGLCFLRVGVCVCVRS